MAQNEAHVVGVGEQEVEQVADHVLDDLSVTLLQAAECGPDALDGGPEFEAKGREKKKKKNGQLRKT